MPRFLSHLLFLCIALMVLLLPLRVQAALPKELPTVPAKFLTGACLTRSEDLWGTAEAGGVWNAPNRRLSVFGNSRTSFAADIGFRQRKNGDEIILPSREKLYKKEGKRLVISGKCCILYASVFGGSASTAAVPGSARAREPVTTQRIELETNSSVHNGRKSSWIC